MHNNYDGNPIKYNPIYTFKWYSTYNMEISF